MRRFLIFPPLFAAWFLAAQLSLMALAWAGAYAAFHFFPPKTDIYFIESRTSPLIFVPAIIIGAVVGCAFAALDFALHRNRRTPKETLSQLLRNGIRSGLVAVALVLLCQGVLLVLAAQENHRRYHAYPRDIEWLNLIHILQPALLLLAMLWAMGKTLLKRPST